MASVGLIDPAKAAVLLDARDLRVFSERLLAAAQSAARVDEMFAYRVTDDGDGPEMIASSSELIDVAERADAYARRFHRSDPAVAARLNAQPDTGFMCRIPTGSIQLGAYRKLCFEQPRFTEKICFGWRFRNSSLVVTFYHRDACEPDMAQLGALAQIAITGLTRQLQRRGTEQPLSCKIEHRLAEAYPQLTARERQICARTLCGKTAGQIGLELDLGVSTVLTYRQRAYQRLGISKANGLLKAIL